MKLHISKGGYSIIWKRGVCRHYTPIIAKPVLAVIVALLGASSWLQDQAWTSKFVTFVMTWLPKLLIFEQVWISWSDHFTSILCLVGISVSSVVARWTGQWIIFFNHRERERERDSETKERDGRPCRDSRREDWNRKRLNLVWHIKALSRKREREREI